VSGGGRLSERLARLALAVLGCGVLVFLVLPVLAVIPMSFSSSGLLDVFPRDPGLDQYRRFFADAGWMRALGRSIEIASGTTVVATILGVLAALGLAQLRAATRQALEAALLLPRIVPTIVFAVAAYRVFLQLGLVGSVVGLIVAHSVLATPFVVVFVGSALRGLDRSLGEASRSLGAGAFTTFFRVILPQIRMAIFGGALFAFNISFDEVVVTLFLSGARSQTLPVKIWDAIQYEVTPTLPAISTLVIIATLLLLLPMMVFGRRGAASSS
jgi:putative spermidine/putrescine transport system permease protein